jgi:hypothetical protein
MTVERGLRMAAGIVILTSVALMVLHSPYWLFLTGFAGLNLFQSAFTNWCPMVWILEKLGAARCSVVALPWKPDSAASSKKGGFTWESYSRH